MQLTSSYRKAKPTLKSTLTGRRRIKEDTKVEEETEVKKDTNVKGDGNVKDAKDENQACFHEAIAC
jgi:hypothetical protein